jgi:hypothetical protein
MRSRIPLMLLFIWISLCAGGCAYLNRPDSGVIYLEFSASRTPDGIATGSWSWKSYNSWAHPNHQRNFIQIRIKEKNGAFAYSSGIAAHELEWISGYANQPEESDAPIHFTFSRPSGEFDFQGRQNVGGMSGNFAFKPNTKFVADVGSICSAKPSLEELITIGFTNASIEDLWRYEAAISSLDLNGWLRLINSGVSPEYASDMKWALGKMDVDALIECRNSGMTSEYASGFTRVGYAFDYKELIQLHNCGMRPEFAAELKRDGMTLDIRQLTALQNSGIQPSYALRMRELGFGDYVEDIIRMRNSGITEDFIADVKKSGYSLSMDEIIKLRNSGVPAGYLNTVKRAGYSFTVDEIIDLHNHGVSENYLTGIIQPGRKPLSADKICNLYSRGVPAETIRDLRAE